MHFGHEDLGPRTDDGPRRGNGYGNDRANEASVPNQCSPLGFQTSGVEGVI